MFSSLINFFTSPPDPDDHVDPYKIQHESFQRAANLLRQAVASDEQSRDASADKKGTVIPLYQQSLTELDKTIRLTANAKGMTIVSTDNLRSRDV